jgi:formylglycine-generating enzyme required for sulfatase activity
LQLLINGSQAIADAQGYFTIPALEEVRLQVSARGWKPWDHMVKFSADESRALQVVLDEFKGPVRGQDYSVDLGGGVTMEFVWISALNAWVGKYEVTNGEFRRFRSGHSSGDYTRNNRTLSLNGDRQPVVQVSFEDAEAFTQWLSGRAGVGEHGARARLLTGDEWTAIARCGTNREYPWGDGWPPTRGNYNDLTAREQLEFTGIDGYRDGFAVSAPVEQSGRNEWGLYGVGGNVWEWTSEQIGSSRVLRGASWGPYDRDLLRVGSRGTAPPSNRLNDSGFRVLLVSGGG